MKYIALVAIGICCVWGQAQGAQLRLIPGQAQVGPNQLFKVDVFLDTQDEDINALEGSIAIVGEVAEIKKVLDGNSIINFWVVSPAINNQRQLTFSGIIPGGYTGKRGLLFSLVIGTKESGKGSLQVQEFSALLNDGKGTKAQSIRGEYVFAITPGVASSNLSLSTQDSTKPDIVMAKITRDPDVFEGKWFLIFAAQDKESGIDHYEVQEAKGNKGNAWKRAQSPLLLADQELASTIYVKAIDKEGNEQEMLVPGLRSSSSLLEKIKIPGILIVGIILTCLLWIYGKRRLFG